MYLSIKQHDQFRTLLMSFEVPISCKIIERSFGALNIVTFSFTNLFRDLYLLFGGYSSYCVLAEKYRYARNKLEHPGCKTLEDTDLIHPINLGQSA